jgi:NAD(P)H-nitrite reductase large subunit
MSDMKPDDKICYCYGVTLRKLVNFARREKPSRASQMSQCFGAGTGCGWCIPMLQEIQEAALSEADLKTISEMTPEQYAEQRRSYIKLKKPRHKF